MFECILLYKGSSIFAMLLESFLLFQDDLHYVHGGQVGICLGVVWVKEFGNVKSYPCHCSIFGLGHLVGFRCGVYFVGSVCIANPV